MILRMSQEKLADALDISYQQIQKYEQGVNRISASRLQQIAHALQVPESFFFDEMPGEPRSVQEKTSASYVSAFLATADGLALAKAFTAIKEAKLRRSIVDLAKQLAGDQ